MRIAVTGGIASGKSTILEHFARLGFTTNSADVVAREIFRQSDTQEELSALLGLSIPVDPVEMRRKISENRRFRRAVNAIMHPPIRQRMRQSEALVCEVPLLVESCTHFRYDFVFLATCPVDVRAARLRARYGENFDPEPIFRTQLTDLVKLPFVDEIIRTDESLDDVHRMIERWVKEFVAL